MSSELMRLHRSLPYSTRQPVDHPVSLYAASKKANELMAGRLLVRGPSFRHFSNPGARGTDSFKLSIRGSSLRVNGTSQIDVEVTSQ
jgi:hypothetical protein